MFRNYPPPSRPAARWRRYRWRICFRACGARNCCTEWYESPKTVFARPVCLAPRLFAHGYLFVGERPKVTRRDQAGEKSVEVTNDSTQWLVPGRVDRLVRRVWSGWGAASEVLPPCDPIGADAAGFLPRCGERHCRIRPKAFFLSRAFLQSDPESSSVSISCSGVQITGGTWPPSRQVSAIFV